MTGMGGWQKPFFTCKKRIFPNRSCLDATAVHRGGFCQKISPFFQLLSRAERPKITLFFMEDTILKKKDKFTQIYFNEADPTMEIDTHNTNLKHRLTAYAMAHPDLCQILYEGEGFMTFAIDKRRCSLRLTAPYSEERKQAASELARQTGVHTRSPKGGRTDG